MDKVIIFFKKGKDFLIHFFSNLTKKRILILVLSLFFVTMIGLSFFKKSSLNEFYDTRELASDYTNIFLSDAISDTPYTRLKNMYDVGGYTYNEDFITILASDMTGQVIDTDHALYGNQSLAYRNKTGVDQPVHLLEFNRSVSYVHTLPGTKLYHLAIDYIELEQNISPTQISITINGVNPFYESKTIVLPAVWELSTTEFKLDRYQNEIQPNSVKIFDWTKKDINDYRGIHPGLFLFELSENDVVEIHYVNSNILIGQIYYVQQEQLLSYQEYLELNGTHPIIKSEINIAARNMFQRNDPSIRLRPEQDSSNLFYNTQFLRLNTIFGDSWQNGGQAVTYQFEVETTGYYHLSFKYRQYMIKDLPVFRNIYIDGSIPFDLLQGYAFPYTTSFINRTLTDEDQKPILIFLEAGSHEITLEAVNYGYRQVIEVIQYVMNEIQSLALDVKRYTSGGTDRYRDWDIELYFPTAKEDIRSWATLLDQTYQTLLNLTNVSEPSEIGNMKVAAARLRDIAKDVNKLPSRMVQFSDGDSSVNQILGNTMQRMMRANMELERTVVHGDNAIDKPFSNIFVRFFEGTKRLVLSFINNPYSASRRKDDELMVWVNHPRQYIEIMQAMIDQKYDGDMKITLSQMPDQNKLVLANASGQAPDVAVGVAHWIPYDFAVRNAALDLRQFEGYTELMTHFSKGAVIPFVFEEGVYGLPETQNFWVTYYRRDILDSIGITHIPQTWDEIIEILPLLQSYGMNYFVPLAQYSGLKPFVATLPFIYQFGGDLYTENGMQTTINSEQTLQGIRLMSELFTLYNIPKFVASFYNNFRYGTIPIGISDLSTYILLETAAVELNGLWDMDLHPGVYDPETDTINRYAAVGGQASMIMSSTKHKEESWNFLKWFMSTEIQSEFAFLLQSTYGQAYFWNSANIDAFKTLSMPARYKDVVLAQWEYALEASRIPGAYMVEREISNAWTRIVFQGMNPRQALDEAVRISNREILYKMAEFGYTDKGVIIKNYRVPSIYTIDYWLTEVER